MTDNPLIAGAHGSTTWYTGFGLAEDAAQISNGIRDNSSVDGTLRPGTGQNRLARSFSSDRPPSRTRKR